MWKSKQMRTYHRILPTNRQLHHYNRLQRRQVGKKTLLLYYIWMGEYWNHRSDRRRQHSYGNYRSVMRRQHSRSDNYHSSMESTSTHQLVPIDQQQSALILWLDRGSNNQLIWSSRHRGEYLCGHRQPLVWQSNLRFMSVWSGAHRPEQRF